MGFQFDPLNPPNPRSLKTETLQIDERSLGSRLIEARAAFQRSIGDRTADGIADAIAQALTQFNANRR